MGNLARLSWDDISELKIKLFQGKKCSGVPKPAHYAHRKCSESSLFHFTHCSCRDKKRWVKYKQYGQVSRAVALFVPSLICFQRLDCYWQDCCLHKSSPQVCLSLGALHAAPNKDIFGMQNKSTCILFQRSSGISSNSPSPLLSPCLSSVCIINHLPDIQPLVFIQLSNWKQMQP